VDATLTLADLNRYAKEAGIAETAEIKITLELSGSAVVPSVYIEGNTIYLA
jgi:hypothetical protein